jgi:hypothetical protein
VSVAARTAGWAQRLRNTPGPLHGASLAGAPFLGAAYGPNARILVELAFGADLTASPDTWPWTDHTAAVMFTGPVSITPMGRGDEMSKAQPAGCAFKLLNLSGDYGKGPASKWYPYVRRNTPVRVRVTLDGSSWYTRFQGFANGFTPSWDTSGKVAVVSVSASGILRRLQQGKSPLRSVLFRSHLAAGPVAYWPLEDGSDATRGASALAGGTPLTWTGTAPTRANGGPPGSEPLWTIANDTDLLGFVGNYTPTTNGWWGFQFVYHMDEPTLAAGITLIPIVEIRCGGTIPKWRVTIDTTWGPDALVLEGFDSTDTRVVAETFFPNGIFDDLNPYGHDIIFGMNIHQQGGNIRYDGAIASPDSSIPAAVWVMFDNTIAGTNGNVTSVRFPSGYTTARPNWVFGHISVWGKQFTLFNYQMYGYRRETATERLARLCAEEGVPIEITGTSDTLMGPQGLDTFLNLLRECETADDGVLYDGRGPGLAYTARTVRYNAPTALTADMAADPPQVDDPFAPVDDDQRNRNLVKVDRKKGSSATYEDNFSDLGTQAIGTYDSSVTVNFDDDDGLYDRAAWEVHKGTVDAPYRHPSLNLDLAATPAVAPGWLAAGVSSRVDVANVTSKATQHPPGNVDLLLEGWAEQLSPFDWDVAGNCSPFTPWRVGVIEGGGDTAWRIDSGSSTLAAGAAVGATSLSVASSDPAEVWSTAAGDYPRSVDVGGVEVTVTAVSGASSPQTFTVTALPYALTAGWTVRLWRPPTIAL